jgi:hypothetical protein
VKKLMTLAAAAALSTTVVVANAQTEGVDIGILECKVEGGAGFVIGSTKDVLCTYSPADSALAPETYHGSISKFGLDIGVTGETRMAWAVVAPNRNIYAPGALAGDYVGVSADASVGVGAGANLLVGGSNKSFTLQPLSVQAQTGVNLAVGVTEFKLRTAAG